MESDFPACGNRDRDERKNPQRVKRSPDSVREVCRPPSAARLRIPRSRSERTLGARTGREGTALALAGFLLRLYRHSRGIFIFILSFGYFLLINPSKIGFVCFSPTKITKSATLDICLPNSLFNSSSFSPSSIIPGVTTTLTPSIIARTSKAPLAPTGLEL